MTDNPLDPSRALVPAVVRVNEQRVSRGFWPKMRQTLSRVPFASDALAVWFCARDAETPFRAKAMAMAALAYFVMPADAVPDLIAGLGYTDDAAVFAALLALIGRHVTARHRDAAKAVIGKLRG
ncbi:YkvA family protein [Phenylobacterium immobile]|uniref:YkvA family protein n=1 Tax=Phenylobacterium immobile TaxID=21 RepID=UPI000AFBBD29|nr:YkvA family protein [Phenylobacterium immobile]